MAAIETPIGQCASPARPLRLRADRRLFDLFVAERNPTDRDAVVERFLPLARQLAARYQRAGEPFEDIFQVAWLGLVKAVDRFDAEPRRGVLELRGPDDHGRDQAPLPRQRVGRARPARPPGARAAGRARRRRAHAATSAARRRSTRSPRRSIEAEDVLEAMRGGAAPTARRRSTRRAPAATRSRAASLGDTIGGVEDGYDRAEQRAVLSHSCAR